MDMETILRQLLNNRIIYKHARVEGEKDGIDELDMREALISGKVIEDYYPERKRVLIAGKNGDGIPIHLVLDYSKKYLIKIVTVYIPDREKFAGYHRRL
jgi:hypothetical protein